MNNQVLLKLILLILVLISTGLSQLTAQETLKVYTSAPGVMVSSATGGTLIEEDFESFSGLPNSNWAPLPNGYISSVGTYKQTAGQSYIKNDDQYGAGTGKYMAIKVGGEVQLTFNESVHYFGFAWPAGDGQNNVELFRNGQSLGTFTTNDVIDLLPNHPTNQIASINGTNYLTKNYYGKPGTGQNSHEPYAFLHFVASSGLAFDKIVFRMGGGGEFENDNHTLLIKGEPDIDGDWVQIISVETPTAFDDSGSGMPGNAVTVDVLQNDEPGDAPIDPATVQIQNTNSPASPLVVPGEGTWTVNPANGKITFTPEAGLIGSPTPIRYFVRDDDEFASNLALVTVTYPTGPTANNDSATTQMNTSVNIDALDNDTVGDAPLDPSTLTLDGTTAPNPATVGTFTVNPNNTVKFTPVSQFQGVATIEYEICDDNGLCDTALITVSVASDGPTAVDDSTTTPMNTPVALDILDNDLGGDAALDPSSVTFVAGTEPNPTTEGTFTYDAGTEQATFTPVALFTGQVTIDYKVCQEVTAVTSGGNLSARNTRGGSVQSGLCDTATITVDITPVDGPDAEDDYASTDANNPVTVDILDNDTPGAAPLDPSTVTFVGGTEPDPAIEGVFTYDPGTELVTFTPVMGYVGITTIDYEICDTNAQCDIATITIEVIAPAGPIDNFFPAGGFGTLAYEDLWPSQGDYDFNDMVIDYQFEITSNAANFIEQVEATFVIKAFGASYQNGFGFQLSQAIDANDLTVTGHSITENYITLNGNGTEAGQARPTIIVFDNAYNEMPHPGGGAIGVNTENSASYVTPVTITVTIDFPANTYTWNQLNIANFNPFLISNMERGREVHLPGYQPTSLANAAFFGQEDDATNLNQGRTYVNANNLPWAIHIYESFDYPIEKQDIIWVHLKFVEWAESGGTLFPNWYQNQSGYRNNALIYQQP